jgi:hypothetical protein
MPTRSSSDAAQADRRSEYICEVVASVYSTHFSPDRKYKNRSGTMISLSASASCGSRLFTVL